MESPKDLRQPELYVGVFSNQHWTAKSLCDYFHQLIEGSSITDCRFFPCTNETKPDHSFAILTFASMSSIDQCLTKRNQIKTQHRLTVKRNLKDIPKDQRAVCQHILIQLKEFDTLYTEENVLAYFGNYGSIIRWKTVDDRRIFLLTFQDTDSVDRICLDQPHFVNQQTLVIEKCYNPYIMSPGHTLSSGATRSLRDKIEQLKHFHESQLIELRNNIDQEIDVARKNQLESKKSFDHQQQIERNLKQNLIEAYRIQEQLKQKTEEAMTNQQPLVEDYENRLEQQKSINKGLQSSIVNLTFTE